MSQREFFELQKEVEFRRRQIVKLEADSKEKDRKVIELEHLVRQHEEQTGHAEATMGDIDRIIAQKVKETSES